MRQCGSQREGRRLHFHSGLLAQTAIDLIAAGVRIDLVRLDDARSHKRGHHRVIACDPLLALLLWYSKQMGAALERDEGVSSENQAEVGTRGRGSAVTRIWTNTPVTMLVR